MNSQYKYLSFLSMLYMTIKITTVVLIYKIISIGPLTASVSSLIIPIWFVLGDMITEIYGFEIIKKIILNALICQFIFACICLLSLSLSSPPGWLYQDAYGQVLGKVGKITIASFSAIIIGALINAYFINRWRILLKGKYFWLRCMGATIIGEILFVAISLITEFWGITSVSNLISLMFVSLSLKALLNPLLIAFASFFTAWIKRAENIDLDQRDLNIPIIINSKPELT